MRSWSAARASRAIRAMPRGDEICVESETCLCEPTAECSNPNFYSLEPEGQSKSYRLECDAHDGVTIGTFVGTQSFTDLAGNLNVNSGECTLRSDTSAVGMTATVHDGLGNALDCSSEAYYMHPPIIFTITRSEDTQNFAVESRPPEQFTLTG
eukprot:SAG11_NODE_10453_length_831_cov_0.688525_2_plen_152_part_01